MSLIQQLITVAAKIATHKSNTYEKVSAKYLFNFPNKKFQ